MSTIGDSRGVNVEWERPKRPNRAKRQTHKRLDGMQLFRTIASLCRSLGLRFICPVSCPCPRVRLCPRCPTDVDIIDRIGTIDAIDIIDIIDAFKV